MSFASNRRFLTILLSAATMLGLGACSAAYPPANSAPVYEEPVAEETSLDARSIVDRHVKTSGGAQAFLSKSTMHSTGTMSIAAQGLEGAMEVWSAAPNKMVLQIELSGFGTLRQGFDGTVGWSMDPASGPQLLEGKALDQIREQSNFYASLYRADDFDQIEFVETMTFADEEAHKIKVVSKSGIESFHFFSVETGLMIGTEGSQHTPMGAIPVTATMSEFQNFGGLTIPTKISQSMMGMQQVLKSDAIDFEDIDLSVFELPEAIKALMEDSPEED